MTSKIFLLGAAVNAIFGCWPAVGGLVFLAWTFSGSEPAPARR
jgi:hypothetical protein